MKNWRKIQIAVFGAKKLTGNQKIAKQTAYEVGKEIAKRGYVLISGGRTGVMEFSCKGCTENGGIALGILPGGKLSDGNQYCTIKIPTGLGSLRNYINASSADGAIVISGSTGTLIEVIRSSELGKPIVCFPKTGNTAHEIAGKIFGKKGKKIKTAKTAQEALNWLEQQIKKK